MLFTISYLTIKKRLKNVVSSIPGINYLWALCVLGIVAALKNGNDIGAMFAVFLAAFFLIGAFVRSVMTRRLFDKIIETSCAASIFAFAVALVQFVAFEGFNDRTCSVFINANYYAAVIEIVVVFAVYKLIRAESRTQKNFYSFVIALNAVGLYFSGCRTAVFALFASISLMLLLYRRYKAMAIFFVSCILFAAIIVSVPELLPRMANLGSDMDTRISIWHRAIQNILKNPLLGEGALAFAGYHFMIGKLTIVHTHNIYLEIILSFGIVGTAFILIYLKKNLLPIWAMRKDNNDRDRFVLALGLLVSIALHGTVDATIFSVQTGVLLFLALGMAGIRENVRTAPVTRTAYNVLYSHTKR